MLAFDRYIVPFLIEAFLLFDNAFDALDLACLFLVFAFRRQAVKALFLPVCRKIPVIAGQTPVLYLKDPVADSVEKKSVVRNEQYRAAVFRKKIFEPCRRVRVQMVRRLVKHQKTAVREKQFCEQHASPVPSAERRHRE